MQDFAFLTADHPDFFRDHRTRRTVKRHLLHNAKQRRKQILSAASREQTSKQGSSDSSERPQFNDVSCDHFARDVGNDVDDNLGKGTTHRPTSSSHIQEDPRGTAPSTSASADRAALERQMRKTLAKASTKPSSQKLINKPNESPPSPLLDRFRQLPDLKNQVVDIPLLLNEWFGSYGRCAPPNYLNFVISCETALTSYCLPMALGRSVRIQEPGRSLEYLTARQDCIRRINNSLRRPVLPNSTVICIKHLLFVDLYVGNKQTLRAHVNAIDRLVGLQGGLENLPLEGEMGSFLQTHVLLACVIGNIRAPTTFSDVRLPAVPFYDAISPGQLPSQVHESPLIWWSEHMSSLLNSEYSSPQLHSLTCELRDLTRDLLLFGSVPPVASNRNYQHILQHHSQSLVDDNIHLKSEIEQRRIWIYESVRLAGLIYAAAIVYHTPVAQAASKAAIDINSSTIREDLGSAILKTDFFGAVPVWGALIGSYVWVALVAAAAGYRSLNSPNNAQRDKEILQRAILTQPATYTFGLFQNPALAPNLFRSLQMMLRVQAILSSTPTPILDPCLFEDAWTPHPSVESGSRPLDELYEMTNASCKRADYNATRFSLPVRSERCRSVG